MYKIIDALASIFKLIKRKEQTCDDDVIQLIKDEVGVKLQQGPFKMWIDAIKGLISGREFTLLS